MKPKSHIRILLAAAMGLALLPSASLSQVSMDVKLTYASKYMWRGYDLWNNHSAYQPDFTLFFGGYGAYLGVWSAYTTTGACQDAFGEPCNLWEEHDFYAGLTGRAMTGSAMEVEWDANFTYYQFFRRHGDDTQEIGLNVTHTGADPLGAVPYWGIYFGWPATAGAKDSRWIKLGVKRILAPGSSPFTALVETVWDDGAGAFGLKKGFSHLKAGMFFETSVGPLKLKPAVYYQSAFRGKDAPKALLEDEFWFEITAAASF